VTVGHVVERCDIIDVLEESARFRRPVAVTLTDGHHFIDQVRQVLTEADGEWAVFRMHDRVLIDDLASCTPAAPPEASYRGKT